jgi:hypothetical protein
MDEASLKYTPMMQTGRCKCRAADDLLAWRLSAGQQADARHVFGEPKA